MQEKVELIHETAKLFTALPADQKNFILGYLSGKQDRQPREPDLSENDARDISA